jgi:hypothetical protein
LQSEGKGYNFILSEGGHVMFIKATIMTFLFVLLIVPAIAASKLPNGYENTKWGMAMEDVWNGISYFPNSSCVSASDKRAASLFAYISDDPKRTSITYNFFNNKLYLVSVEMRSPAESIIADLKRNYGEPNVPMRAFSDGNGKHEQMIWSDGENEVIYERYLLNKNPIWRSKIYFSSKQAPKGIEQVGKTKIKTTIK